MPESGETPSRRGKQDLEVGANPGPAGGTAEGGRVNGALGLLAVLVLTAATGYFVAQEFAFVTADR